MKKKEALQRWHKTPEGQNPLDHMKSIPYKAKGSRFGACGIRIEGTPAFIDSVLSNLKPLLEGENTETRLQLARSEVKPTKINDQVKNYDNAVEKAEVCYIRLHERGHEAKHVNRIMRRK